MYATSAAATPSLSGAGIAAARSLSPHALTNVPGHSREITLHWRDALTGGYV